MSFLKKNKTTVLFGFFVITLLGWLATRLTIQRLSPRPEDMGVEEGRLKLCPTSPNCVSTFDTDELHGMVAIPYTGNAAAAQNRLLTILQNTPRTRLITNEPGYIRVEFRSLVWRFVDDGEFYLDETARVIHFRSASRLGYGDNGVNRTRMEQVQAAFLSAPGE